MVFISITISNVEQVSCGRWCSGWDNYRSMITCLIWQPISVLITQVNETLSLKSTIKVCHLVPIHTIWEVWTSVLISRKKVNDYVENIMKSLQSWNTSFVSCIFLTENFNCYWKANFYHKVCWLDHYA